MMIRFQADAEFSYTIAKTLCRSQSAIDFQSAYNAKLCDLLDPDVLTFAAKEGRILVSHDCNTMPEHFADFVVPQHSPGVFILAQDIPISLGVEELLPDGKRLKPQNGLMSAMASAVSPTARSHITE